ncbi:BTAD domain-containing putative transcriptional regulator [Streptomyces sp. NPDC048297]|uniref:AfsR/SARP family transcriptional regulator n=1 Tax=Streptomyces sp. NPDC048297 TaxID=3365531 RepID=UPI00371725CD
MAHIRVSVLGPLRVSCGETKLNLGSPQQQAMFVALLMRSGRSATAADLVEALWGEEDPASAVTTLRTYAWRLRKALEADGAFPRILQSVGGGYQLDLPDDHVDYLQAEKHARSAERARRAGEATRAYEETEAALSLWHGEPLAALPGPFAAGQRHRLDELRLSLMEERLGLGLELGLGSGYVAELHSLIDQHPLRERLYCLLMRAQCLAGRRAEALSTYRDARKVVIDELGVEPGPELTALHQRILSGDQELVPKRRTEGVTNRTEGATKTAPVPTSLRVPASTPTPTPTPIPTPNVPRTAADEDTPARREPPRQLPPQPSDFLGRSHLATTLASALTVTQRSALPVVVLVGMGGIGKSALALHVAHHISDAYPDGQLYAELRSGDGDAVTPETVLACFLSALGLRQDRIPETLQERSALFRTLVSHRRMLIVLDDAQQAAQVRPLLPGEATCGVLITSRARLGGLPAALQTELGVFHPSEALELMARTISSQRVEAEPEATLRLMESCGFLPLAVRIVAARLAARPSWSIDSLAVRLADERRRINELRVGDMAVATVFDLTFRQLTEAQARGLCLVSSIATPELSVSSAAATLAVDEATAEELLESLVDAAMLESLAAGRYRFPTLMRSFVHHHGRFQVQ